MTAVALSQTRADYSGKLRLTPRRPDVHCETITNICVTDRALEETVVLDYRIESAGVREVSFLLPAWMADARIHVPLLRQKTLSPVNKEESSPIRVRLELQDEVMGDLQVLIESDRMLEPGVDYRAAIPEVLKGESYDTFSVRRFVALEKAELEKASLDNVVFDEDRSKGLERLNRRQHQWTQLKQVLGDRIIEAFEGQGRIWTSLNWYSVQDALKLARRRTRGLERQRLVSSSTNRGRIARNNCSGSITKRSNTWKSRSPTGLNCGPPSCGALPHGRRTMRASRPPANLSSRPKRLPPRDNRESASPW